MVEGNGVDGAEAGQVVFEGRVVPPPGHDIERRKALLCLVSLPVEFVQDRVFQLCIFESCNRDLEILGISQAVCACIRDHLYAWSACHAYKRFFVMHHTGKPRLFRLKECALFCGTQPVCNFL